MKIKVNTEIKDIKGNTIQISESSNEVITARLLIVNSLTAEISELKETGLDKFKKYKLATKIENTDNNVEITIEEAKLIKDSIGHVYTAIFVGRIFELLGEK